MKQGDIFIAKKFFTMKIPGARGRPASVSIGDKFWITSTEYSHKQGIVKIDRINKGSINCGYAMSINDFNGLFEKE